MVPTLLTFVLSAQDTNPLMVRQTIDDPLRLALTPQMDGTIGDEEWEPLCDVPGGRTYFQWEPGKFYWAAKAQTGKDVVLTLDANGDGWLVGDDNVEVRCRFENGGVKATVRQLDATNRNGPKWVSPEIVEESLKLRASQSSDGYWSLEAAFEPIQFTAVPEENRRIGMRMDVLSPDQESGPAYMPRALSFLTMRYDTSQGLFDGLAWHPSTKTRSISRFDNVRFRFSFEVGEASPVLQSVEMGGEGYASEVIKQVTVPFPTTDKRGNGFVDYDSDISSLATSGYRILRATVTAKDGRKALLRTSFRVADLVDLDPNFKMDLNYSDQPQRIKGGVTIRSQSTGKIDGKFSVRYPESWSAVGDLDRDFLIYHSRGYYRVPIEFMVPAGTRGVFPILISAKVGGESIFRTVYVTVK